ncbi:uncharacterized protein LOC111263490 isoform X2 [Varroa jacobsoni]|nr:uncharacterized protein LOC111263490 isoform X2 [Varroa jacobsoni]
MTEAMLWVTALLLAVGTEAANASRGSSSLTDVLSSQVQNGSITEVSTGSPREVRYVMAVKDANDTSVYETQSGSKIIIGRAARARADLIARHHEQRIAHNNATLPFESRQRQGRIVNNAVAVAPESRIVNDPEAYAHIPAFGGTPPTTGFQPVESIRKDDVQLSQVLTTSQHTAKKAFERINIIDKRYRPVQKPIYDKRIVNRPYVPIGGSLPSLGPIPPAAQNECVCVRHYQCDKDGFLIGSTSGFGVDSYGSNAGSYPPNLGFAEPISPPPPRRFDPVPHHDQSFLDIDERSNDDNEELSLEGRSADSKANKRAKDDEQTKQDNDMSRPKRELPTLNEKFIGEIKDDEANSTKGVESRREEAPAYATEIMQRMLGVNFGHCGVLKTCCRIPPSYDRNALPADSFPLKAAAFAPDSKRVNSFTDFDNKPGFGKQDFPQAFVPSSDSDFSGAYPPVSSIGLQQSYPTCGSRNSYGARGRVANLNYPESGTDFAEFPWHVGIMKRLGPHESLYVCGGVLIASQWIATAAHCLKNLRPHELKVRLGEWDVHREDELYAHVEKLVTDVVIHPEFFPGNLNNDLALLRMDGPVDLNAPHIAAACLPEVAVNFIGQHCWVTGWGKDAFGPQGAYQHVLRKVDVPLLDPLDCQDRLRKTRLGLLFKLHTSFVCAGGEPGKDACTGDGGSPLVCEDQGVWKVVGLVSWGIGCGTPGVPGVYVNMAKFRPWIETVLASASVASE